MRTVKLLTCALVCGLTACCGGEETGTTSGDQPSGEKLSFETGEFDVPEGDSFECIYTDTITDHEINVTGATGTQAAGGHHIVVYYTDTPREPTHHPCIDAEMVSWHQVAGASPDGGEPVLVLPKGTAIKVPAGKQLVIQSHYINTTGATMKVNDKVSIDLAETDAVKEFLNYWVMVDLGFQVAPNSTGKSVTTCTVTEDIQTVLLLGHMHELGKHYKLERIDDQGVSQETIFETDWDPVYVSHPPLVTSTLEEPRVFTKGTRFRQTCEWNNNTPDPVLFPREMCLAFTLYFPDKGYFDCDAQAEASP
jgi:hypothetical protein